MRVKKETPEQKREVKSRAGGSTATISDFPGCYTKAELSQRQRKRLEMMIPTPEPRKVTRRMQPRPPASSGISRPANNQLLYRAKFDWSHYPRNALDEDFLQTELPQETKACASVSSAFLQTMKAIQTAEKNRVDGRKRNALKLLSANTRKTKVVALSSLSSSSGGDGSAHTSNDNENKNKKGESNGGGGKGAGGQREAVLTTHRVPEDLKKHHLYESEDGVEYGTNLDRNRYGTDTDYLHTCIRYNVKSLKLCEKLVNIEIVDSKGSITAATTVEGTDASDSNRSRRKKSSASALPFSPSSTCVRIVREGESKCQCEEINKEIQSMTERKEIFDPTGELVWPQVGKKHGNLGNRNRTKNKSSTTTTNNNNKDAFGATPTPTTTTNTTTTTTTTTVTTTGAMCASYKDPRLRKENRGECGRNSSETNNEHKLEVLLDALTQVGGIQITPNGTPSRPTKERKGSKMDDSILAECETQRAASPAAIPPAKDKAFGGTLSLAVDRAFASTPPPDKVVVEAAEKKVEVTVATTNNIENTENTEAIRAAIIAATKESIDAIPQENLRNDLRNAVVCAYERHIEAIVAENNRRYAEINVDLLGKEILSLREELRSLAMTNASLRLKRAATETATREAKTKIQKQKKNATNASSLKVVDKGESSEEEVTTPRNDTTNDNVLAVCSSLKNDIAQVKRRLERALESDAEPAARNLFFQEAHAHLTTLLRLVHCEVLLNASGGKE